nr:Crp/Fnr family transcriptional regulator [Methylocaldum sp. RMAD-M]
MNAIVSKETLQGLKSVPYFSEVPDTALAELASCAAIKSYPKNSIIIREGEEGGALFIILSGKVQAYLSSANGRMVILSTQGAGSFFGELSLLDGEPRSASITALEPTVCSLIPRLALKTWLKSHPDAASSIIRSLTQRIRSLTENVRGLALSDVYGRLVKTLYDMAVENENEWIIREKPTHQDLANIIGCSREMVSRIMKDLERGGYLSVERKFILIRRKLPASW